MADESIYLGAPERLPGGELGEIEAQRTEQGRRVLAVARGPNELPQPPGEEPPSGLVPLGIAGTPYLVITGIAGVLFAMGDPIFGFALCVPILLLLIFVEVGLAGWPALRQFGFGFLTSSTWDPVAGQFGAAPADLCPDILR